MRIMFYTQLLNMGGMERTVTSLSNELVNDNEITIVQYTSIPPFFTLDNRVKYIQLGFISDGLSKVSKAYKLIKLLRTEIINSRTQAIFCMNKSHLLFLKIAKFGLNSVLIGTERTNPQAEKSIRAISDRFFAKLSDGFVFQTARSMIAYPKSVRDIACVIPNAICNPDVLLNVPNKNKREEIVAAGRLTKNKGFDILIKAFSRICNMIPDYKLTIFGEGEDRDRLEAIILEEGLSNKINLPGKDLHAFQYIMNSSIFVLSSTIEGMPNSLIEAMACGIACISTNCDFGPAELITDGFNGILTPVNDVQALAAAVLRVATNENLRLSLGRNAYMIRDELSIDKISQRWLEYCKQLYIEKYNESTEG